MSDPLISDRTDTVLREKSPTGGSVSLSAIRGWVAATPLAGMYLWVVLLSSRRRPPVTLNEKIRYRMAQDRRPLLVTLVDKVAVRDFVSERADSKVLPELLSTVDSFADLRVDELPNRCVIKPSHGSGVALVVDDRAPEHAALPRRDPCRTWQYLKIRLRREALEGPRFERLARAWLKANYSNVGGGWCYRNVPRHLIVEELLDDGYGALPVDYRIWCVQGRPVLISRDEGWGADMQRVRLTPEWLPLTHDGSGSNELPDRPETLEEMLALASRLSAGIDFIRVDLYDVQGHVMFGELTPYPGGGRARFSPEETYTALFMDWRPDEVLRSSA